jgi:hypothetical protein
MTRRLLCTHCRRLLPAAAFRPNPSLRLGFTSWCRECQVAATRRWRAANRDRINALRRTGLRAPDHDRQKPCRRCGHLFTVPAGRKGWVCDECQLKARQERDRAAWLRRRDRLAAASQPTTPQGATP